MSSEPRETALIVEDDTSLRTLLQSELEEEGLIVTAVSSGEEAIALLQSDVPTLVLSDLRLPGIDGIQLLDRIQSAKLPRVPPFIVITAFGTVDRAVEALKRGAADFLTKPLDLDHLRLRVQRIREIERLRTRITRYRAGSRETPFHGIIGQSAAMVRLFDEIRQVAGARGPVLIAGDSGVGKELVARAIHRESDRRDGPFVPINCASVPEALLESEFFGHASGAFTGATKNRQGLFAQAHGGTLLLDEVAELPASLQAKLLRVLQEGAVRRVGSEEEVRVDVRVVAATNQDLEEGILAGRFRKDLFYRLGTFILEVPSLAERERDVEHLVAHFLTTFAAQAQKRIEGLSPEALERLNRYSFPGNVRELENVIEHAVTFCRGSIVELNDLPRRVREQQNGGSDEPGSGLPPAILADGSLLTLEELSARYVRHVIEITGGNKKRAAKLLGISRQTLYRYLR